MKNLAILTFVLGTLVLASCGSLGGDLYFETKEGITELISELKSNYGETIAISSITIANNENVGNSVAVQANNDINSKKLMEKVMIGGMWTDNSEITMEIDGGKMSDFLFTLDEVDLYKIPELVKDAKERVSKEKEIAEVKVTTVTIAMPKTVSDKLKDLNYSIIVEPKNGGTSFVLRYDLSGNFIDMNY